MVECLKLKTWQKEAESIEIRIETLHIPIGDPEETKIRRNETQ